MINYAEIKDSWRRAHYQLGYKFDVVSCLEYALNEIQRTKVQCSESDYIKDTLKIVRTFKIKDNETGQLYELNKLDAEFLNNAFYLTEKFKTIQWKEGVLNFEVFSSLRIYNDDYNKEKTLNSTSKLDNVRIDFKSASIKDLSTSYLPSFIRNLFK